MILFLDTETTGVNRSKDRLVQLGWVVTDENGSEVSRSVLIIKPEGFTIPEKASNIHRITTKIAYERGIPLKSALRQLQTIGQKIGLIVAHNLTFDIGILKEEFRRAGVSYPFTKTPSVCTMKSSTDFCKIPRRSGGYKYPSLTELFRYLFGYDFRNAHDALADAEACKQCYFELVKRNVLNTFSSGDRKCVPEQVQVSSVTTADNLSSAFYIAHADESRNLDVALESSQRKIGRKENRIGALKIKNESLQTEVSRLNEEVRLAEKEYANQKAIDRNHGRCKPKSDSGANELSNTSIPHVHSSHSHREKEEDVFGDALTIGEHISVQAYICHHCGRTISSVVVDRYKMGRCPACGGLILGTRDLIEVKMNTPDAAGDVNTGVLDQSVKEKGVLDKNIVCVRCKNKECVYMIDGLYKYVCSECGYQSNIIGG